uniref:Renal cancer differentiation gene 1 protein isoform X1 n=1 Tax=Geotrypetes seraphini TaxID=260995 RepID=A0A6P8R9H2_GEOSA|nr:renal cancer differentiation gene 1 protein isoform X1 [Geotrypetes seraphini]
MATKRKTSSATESAPKREKKVKTLPEKVELLDMLHRVKSASAVARYYGINESTVRYIKKKEIPIREAVAAGTPAGAKTLHVVRDTILSRVETATFMWVQDCYNKRIPVDSVLIRGKAKSLYDSLKKREDGLSQSMDFLASKGWFDKFRHRYGLHNVKMTGEAASANQAREFHATFKEIIEEKRYETEQAFNADETAPFWKRMPQRTFISKEIKRAPGFKAARDIEDLTNTRSNKLTEDDLIHLTAPEGEEDGVKVKKEEVEDEEEDGVKVKKEEVLEDKFTLDNIAEGLRRFNALMDFFYDIDPSMVRALKVKELAEAAMSTYMNIYKEMKKQKSQMEITRYCQKIPRVTASPSTSSTSTTHEEASPSSLPLPPPPTLQHMYRTMRMKTPPE